VKKFSVASNAARAVAGPGLEVSATGNGETAVIAF
jgi:hypothetical protein